MDRTHALWVSVCVCVSVCQSLYLQVSVYDTQRVFLVLYVATSKKTKFVKTSVLCHMLHHTYIHTHVYTRSHVACKQANHVYTFTHHEYICAYARAICIHLHNRQTYICTHIHAQKNTNSLLGIDFLMYR